MRGAGIDPIGVESLVAAPRLQTTDANGNAVLMGIIDGRCVEVVVALDDSGFVITVIPRRKRR